MTIEWSGKGMKSIGNERFTKRNGAEIEIKNIQEAIRKLAELEDMIEDGTLTKLPCNVGDTVYYIRNGLIYFSTISTIEIFGDSIRLSMEDHYYGYTISFDSNEFGKRIFFTTGEVQEKLEELKNK